ncbi:predicted protein [Botrytis cinerea T4]|uniref:Uncharacterized protein n=1 Tax=Botryotinia fuckeliana (strain T4) TaxID=999810 RepID=G2YYW9_BOTF4|nr:predicted protein [Botrytis cinerea T4]
MENWTTSATALGTTTRLDKETPENREVIIKSTDADYSSTRHAISVFLLIKLPHSPTRFPQETNANFWIG